MKILAGVRLLRATTTMAFLGLLEGKRNQPKPHADLFSEVMVKKYFSPTDLFDEDVRRRLTMSSSLRRPALKPARL